jgi:hypothetical protein
MIIQESKVIKVKKDLKRIAESQTKDNGNSCVTVSDLVSPAL